jgi:hypothetical protein
MDVHNGHYVIQVLCIGVSLVDFGYLDEEGLPLQRPRMSR